MIRMRYAIGTALLVMGRGDVNRGVRRACPPGGCRAAPAFRAARGAVGGRLTEWDAREIACRGFRAVRLRDIRDAGSARTATGLVRAA